MARQGSATLSITNRLGNRVILMFPDTSIFHESMKVALEPAVPAARTFVSSYARVQKSRRTWSKEMGEGESAVSRMVASNRGWLPVLASAVPGFAAADYFDGTDLPDEHILNCQNLCNFVRDYHDGQGNALPFEDRLLNDLLPLTETASREWTEAVSANAEYQRLVTEMHTHADIFDIELQRLRKVILAHYGSGSSYYQRLRASRVREEPTNGEAQQQQADGAAAK